MDNKYDVIVVGARCAGASLAAFLGRAGARVLVVDADPLPSDMIMSTHALNPPAAAVLDELGILEPIREVTPDMRTVRVQFDDAVTDLEYAGKHVMIAPRRLLLDTLLQESATRAGAELRERTKVTGLVWEDGRVCGVRVERGGRTETIHAPIVVGADGGNSTVARLAGAYEYCEYESPRPGYWAYWPEPAWFGTEVGHSFDLYMGMHGDRIRYIFRTDSNLVLLATTAPVETFERWRSGDHRAAYLEDIRRDPAIAPLTEGAEPVSPIRGAFRIWYGFRQAAGPGWALVGDAGTVKDYTLGEGITDALLHAKLLAHAILEGTDGALQRYWMERDVESLPIFRFSQDWGEGDEVTELERVIYRHVSRSDALKQAIIATTTREIDPYEALPTGLVVRWALGAMLRGRLEVLPQLLAVGARTKSVAREVADRRFMLEQCAAGNIVAA
jgi:menaquinone-9 beta-reductase